MTKMRAKPWVLLTTTLTFASAFGCAEAGPDGDQLSDGQVSPIVDGGTGVQPTGSNDAGATTGGPSGGQMGQGQPGGMPGATPGGMPGSTSGGGTPGAGGSPTMDAGGGPGGKTDAGPATTSDAATTTDAAPVNPGTGGSVLPPVDAVDKDGPYKPTSIKNGGKSGSSWVFYPMELGKDGVKHPIFNWGPGAGTGPDRYVDHLNRLASHGFVVISQPSSGNGTTEKASLDWLIAENDKQGSTFYQKLDTKRVGAGGHSLGSLTTMKMAGDPRLTTYVLVCGGCMSGNGGCGAKDIHGPTVILGGDTDIGTPNYEGDYKEITTPVVFLTKNGTDHIACARNNLAPWVAFMRWHMAGDDKWKPKFFEGGEYCMTPWKCKSKNF